MGDCKLNIVDLGLQPYKTVWDYQKYLFSSLIEQKQQSSTAEHEYLLLVEHTPVYTIGKHGKTENMLLNLSQLESRKAEYFHIERGGDITFHGPGQLVVYPIIDLSKHHFGVKSYVDILEECVIRLLALYGIKGERVYGATGVWLDKGSVRERKICAIGVKCSRFVSMHGFALNVNTNLDWFSAINPCGFTDKGVTSIAQELGKEVSMLDVKEQIVGIFSSLLSEKQ